MQRPSLLILILAGCLSLAANLGKAQPVSAADQPLAQNPVQLDARAAEIKRKVEETGLASKITVVLKDGTERYGSVAQFDAASFQIIEVDLKQRITINYADVKKVRRNYGGKNHLSGKRPNPLWGKIAGVALIVGLVVIVAAAGGGA